MSFCWTGVVPARHCARVSFFIALLVCWLSGTPGIAAMIDRVDVGNRQVVVQVDPSAAAALAQLRHGPTQLAALNGGDVRQGRAPLVLTFGDGSDVKASRSGDRDAARGYHVSMPVPPAKKGPPLPAIYGADDSRPLVVIDPGHGGHDPGAISPDTGLQEKDLTLKIAKAIRDQLVASGRVRVALTRSDDRYLQLRERYQIARRLHADLFISIHCDSAGNADATGATAYTLSEVSSDREAARLAARENKADVIAGVDLDATSDDVSSLLIDLTQRETMNDSSDFARLLGREAKALMPIKDNFHRMASLMVLKAPDMPSILFETGYISNPVDAAFLNSGAGDQRIAQSVARAVDIHFAKRLASN